MAHTLTAALPLDPTAYLHGLRRFERAAQRTIEATHEAFSHWGEALGRAAEMPSKAFAAAPMAHTIGAAQDTGRPAETQPHVRELDSAAPAWPERDAAGLSSPSATEARAGVANGTRLAWQPGELDWAERLCKDAPAGPQLPATLAGLDLQGALGSAAVHDGQLDRAHGPSLDRQMEAVANRNAGEPVNGLGAAVEVLHDRALPSIARHMEAYAPMGGAGATGLGADALPAMLTACDYALDRPAAQGPAPLLDATDAGAVPGRMHSGGPVFAARETGGGPVANHYGPVNQHFSVPIDRHTIRSVIIPEIERARARGKV